jgi:hypothetical protein
MRKRVLSILFPMVILAFALPLHQAAGQPTATVSVEPIDSFGLSVGDIVTINVTVSNVIDLAAWQFTLYYQPAVLNGTSVAEGSFLASTGDPTFFSTLQLTDNYNATYGAVSAFDLIMNGTGVDGNGTLATVTFKAVGRGPSVLIFDLTGTFQTKLIDSSPGAGNLIPFTAVGGLAYCGKVDVAIGEISTPQTIPSGSNVNINVTAENRGDEPETFNVTLLCDGNPVDGTRTVLNLPPGESQTLSFTWDTTSTALGQHVLEATATNLLGQMNTADLTLSIPAYVGIRDIAVTGIVSKTSIPAGLPGTALQVAVQNNGQTTETFNVTVTAGSYNETETTTLPANGGNGTVNFFWNTTTLSYGNYTLEAYVTPLPFETNTTNNSITVQVSITIPGDLNGDFKVDLADLTILAKAYGSRPGDANWNPNADIMGTGVVGLSDLVTLATHYGQHYP